MKVDEKEKTLATVENELEVSQKEVKRLSHENKQLQLQLKAYMVMIPGQ